MNKIAYIRAGGQTGVDRAALDCAKKYSVPIIGWCPKGGWAEDYPVAPGLTGVYKELKETPLSDPAQRTCWNARDSHATLVILPVSSQNSYGTILTKEAAKSFNRPFLVVSKVDDIDTIILGRGGGSAEDLDAFNSEKVARTVFASPFPVISAVGHETDITICDLVADLRAPTPSAAAELAVPDLTAVKLYSENLSKKVSSYIEKTLEIAYTRLNAVKNLSLFKNPEAFVLKNEMYVDKLEEKICFSFEYLLNLKDKQFTGLALKIDALSPLKCLSRGYSVVYKGDKTITNINDVDIGDELKIRTNDGTILCNVTNKE